MEAGAVLADGGEVPIELGQDELSAFVARLEGTILGACTVDSRWPAQVAAAIYAGVDFAIANPALARGLALGNGSQSDPLSPYTRVISRLTTLLRAKAPTRARLPATTDEALVAGIVGLVGDHIRIGRPDRLAELRPELVLLTLLPYLGFAEAQRWANQTAGKSFPKS